MRFRAAANTVLSPRLAQVLALRASGLSSNQIGESLGISGQTVKNHMHTILSRLGLHSCPEAVAVAIVNGWIIAEDTAPHFNPQSFEGQVLQRLTAVEAALRGM